MASERIANEYDSTRIANALDTLAENVAHYADGSTVDPTDAMKAKLPSQSSTDRIANALEQMAEDVTQLNNVVIADKEVSPAGQAHTVDTYLTYDHVEYKVISAIAIGDALTVGTNIELANLPDGTMIATNDGDGGASASSIVDNLFTADSELSLSANMGNLIATDMGSIEPTNIATAAHDTDSYFINAAGKFVRVTADIAIGDTIAVGTNVVETTIGAEIARSFIEGEGGIKAGSILLGSNTVTLDNSNRTAVVNVVPVTDAEAITVSSSDDTIATASLNDGRSRLTVTGLKGGEVEITLSSEATDNYPAASTVLNVSSDTIYSDLVVGTSYRLNGSEKGLAKYLGTDNGLAIFQSEGFGAGIWPGSEVLSGYDTDIYVGEFSEVINEFYLPRYSSNRVSVYTGSSWTVDYTANATAALATAAANGESLDAQNTLAWLGTEYDSIQAWYVFPGGTYNIAGKTNYIVIAPCFTIPEENILGSIDGTLYKI